MKNVTCTLAAGILTLSAIGAFAATDGCDPGEIVIKFSHIVKHRQAPQGHRLYPNCRRG